MKSNFLTDLAVAVGLLALFGTLGICAASLFGMLYGA